MSINYNPTCKNEVVVCRCPNCGAELYGTTQDNSVVCAECGAQFDPNEQRQEYTREK